MKTISIVFHGSDGSLHGHGDCDWGEDDWEVTDRQYAKIKEFVDKGETDLLSMHIHGLVGRCNSLVDEFMAYMDNPDECDVFFTVSLPGEEDEGQED